MSLTVGLLLLPERKGRRLASSALYWYSCLTPPLTSFPFLCTHSSFQEGEETCLIGIVLVFFLGSPPAAVCRVQPPRSTPAGAFDAIRVRRHPGAGGVVPCAGHPRVSRFGAARSRVCAGGVTPCRGLRSSASQSARAARLGRAPRPESAAPGRRVAGPCKDADTRSD